MNIDEPPSSAWSSPHLPPPTAPAPQSTPAHVPIEFELATSPHTAAPPPRRRGAVAAVVVALLAIGAAAVFAVSRISGTSSGGASSPEQVGRDLMTAIDEEDLLGVIDLMLPGERETFRQPAIDLVSEFSRLGVVDQSMTLADIDGFDFIVAVDVVSAQPTNADDIANIVVVADVTTIIDGSELPIGDLITDLAGDDFERDSLDVTNDETIEWRLTTVRHDGSWYLSLFHSAAEEGRLSAGSPPIPDGLEPRGGDSPEGAIDALLDGVEQLDLAKIVAAINPEEAAALQRYAPLFLDEAQAALDEVPISWQITDVTYTVDGSGAEREVDVDSMRIVGEIDSMPLTVETSGSCATISFDDETIDTCQQQQFDLDELLGEAEPVRRFVDEVTAAFADYDAPGITVREVDGAWYVSPIGSGFDQFLAMLRALDRSEIDRMVEAGGDAISYVVGELGGLGLPLGDDFVVGDPFSDDPSAGDQYGGDQNVDDEPFSDEAYEREEELRQSCYAQPEIASCLQGHIDAGDLPPWSLPTELKYPECGLSGIVTGEMTMVQLSDEEYTALITFAHGCFAELIEAGEVTEFEVPADYQRIECAEGRNPWRFDDDGLFDRWIECIYS